MSGRRQKVEPRTRFVNPLDKEEPLQRWICNARQASCRLCFIFLLIYIYIYIYMYTYMYYMYVCYIYIYIYIYV